MTLQGFQFLQIASQVATKESHSKLFCAFYDVFIKDFAGKSKKTYCVLRLFVMSRRLQFNFLEGLDYEIGGGHFGKAYLVKEKSGPWNNR